MTRARHRKTPECGRILVEIGAFKIPFMRRKMANIVPDLLENIDGYLTHRTESEKYDKKIGDQVDHILKAAKVKGGFRAAEPIRTPIGMIVNNTKEPPSADKIMALLAAIARVCGQDPATSPFDMKALSKTISDAFAARNVDSMKTSGRTFGTWLDSKMKE